MKFKPLLAATLLATLPLTAQSCPGCEDFDVGAHALVFQPLSCRYDFARRLDDDSASTIGTIDPSLQWGFRVWGKYIRDCAYISLGYQKLDARQSGRLLGDESVTNRHNPFAADEATAHLLWRYQNVEGRLGSITRFCKGEAYGFLSARWVNLEYTRHGELLGLIPAPEVSLTLIGDEQARLEAAALGLGLGGRRDLFCHVGLFGELTLLGVIGGHKTDAEFVVITDEAGLISVTTTSPGYSALTTITPEIDFRLGLDYTWCCGCWTFTAEVGYELDYFWNAFDFPSELNADIVFGDDDWVTRCENVGFSGLFFGAHVLF